MASFVKCSYELEACKLGHEDRITRFNEHQSELAANEDNIGLPLTFTEDRLLNTIQTLLFQHHYQPSGTALLSEAAQEAWQWTEPVPVMTVETAQFCALFDPEGKSRSDKVLRDLRDLANRQFLLSYNRGTGKNPRYVQVHSNLFALSEYHSNGKAPAALRMALSPLLFDGITPLSGEKENFMQKPLGLHEQFVQELQKERGSGSKQGRYPDTLPRLLAFAYQLQKSEVPEARLAFRLRKTTMLKNAKQRFRDDVKRHLNILKASKLIKDFQAPTGKETKWFIHRT